MTLTGHQTLKTMNRPSSGVGPVQASAATRTTPESDLVVTVALQPVANLHVCAREQERTKIFVPEINAVLGNEDALC